MKRLTVAAALLRRRPAAVAVPPSPSTTPGCPRLSTFCSYSMSSTVAACASECDHGARGDKRPGKWLRLPPFEEVRETGASKTTAVKWVLRCCPDLPRNLVHKLFRLRQVRKESNYESQATQVQNFQLARVIAKDPMNSGDRICLPITIEERPQTKKQEFECSSEEVNFVHGLVLHKDDAIVVVNKPPGMPVQGGTGIKRSLDELAITCLKYEYSEKPRLVHRLDRDCSGILVMGRNQASATYLHSLFREKTAAAMNKDPENRKSLLRRKYWALVIGSPRRPKGLISAPLAKVLIDEGKSDRITVVDSIENVSSNHAVTEYEVLGYNNGYSWLELSPLTGRKHQLRVHCAEVLRTPIVGDYKYGWQAHKKCKQLGSSKSNFEGTSPNRLQREALPFGLDLKSGSISDKEPRLHLHCKQIFLPDVSSALKRMRSSSRQRSSELEIVKLVAPLPPYMQKSLEILQQPQHTCEQSSMDRIVVALDFDNKLIKDHLLAVVALLFLLGFQNFLYPFLHPNRAFRVDCTSLFSPCCHDDLSAMSLGSDLLVHFGHSCLVPISCSMVPAHYKFVEITIDTNLLVEMLKLNFLGSGVGEIILAGTIQFAGGIREAKGRMEEVGFRVVVPQARPLSKGEMLGCTAPRVPLECSGGCSGDGGLGREMGGVFVADGRFHKEAFMIANPGLAMVLRYLLSVRFLL